MAQNHFLAGVGRALIFRGDNLIGVAKTLQESTFNFSITGEDIRGGNGNALWGKYFHDSNLGVTLVDAMFNLEYMAASLGVDIKSGGISVVEEELTVGTAGGEVEVSKQPVAFDGSLIGWYKKPADSEWKIGTFTDKNMSINGAKANEHYCVKYFYFNEDAKSITIKTQYVPAELHVVILNDLFAGDIAVASNATRYGRLITDIPRLQMDGSQDLSLSATGAATVSLTGNALAVNAVDSCEENPYYGTMTEEIFGAKWQDDVVAIAVENGDVRLAKSASETLSVRVVFGGSVASQRKDNSNFVFAIESEPASTAIGTTVGESDGKITASTTAGNCVVSVTLKDAPAGVEPAYVLVTVE